MPKANVRVARPDATCDEIETALCQAALAEYVADSPNGLMVGVAEPQAAN
jgi:ABC-type transport system involved in Fe-S cluster assembly fused permease/ATPase subunit